jgi:hypothetical protein
MTTREVVGVHCLVILVTTLPGSMPSTFEIASATTFSTHVTVIKALITDLTPVSPHVTMFIAIAVTAIEVLRKSAGH